MPIESDDDLDTKSPMGSSLGPVGPFGSEGAIQPTLIAMMTSVVLTVLNIVQLPQCA